MSEDDDAAAWSADWLMGSRIKGNGCGLAKVVGCCREDDPKDDAQGRHAKRTSSTRQVDGDTRELESIMVG